MITVRQASEKGSAADDAAFVAAMRAHEPKIDAMLGAYHGSELYWSSNGLPRHIVERIADAYRAGGWIARVIPNAGPRRGRGPWIAFKAGEMGKAPAVAADAVERIETAMWCAGLKTVGQVDRAIGASVGTTRSVMTGRVALASAAGGKLLSWIEEQGA